MLNILTEPIIHIDVSDGKQIKVSLPETYALLMKDKVESFPALRPHSDTLGTPSSYSLGLSRCVTPALRSRLPMRAHGEPPFKG